MSIETQYEWRRNQVCRLVWQGALLLVGVFSTFAGQNVRAQSVGDEYEIKAAFLFHFAQLVEWPANVSPEAGQTLTFCVYQDDPANDEIRIAVEDKRVGKQVFRFRSLRTIQDVHSCQVVFMGRSESRRQSATLKELKGLPILTVGETDDFFSDGGMIRFHLDGGRIRFDVDVGAAESSRVKISSRILLLASSVLHGSSASPGGR